MSSSAFPPGRGPNLFILGAPKCGTTSMAAYLQQHPEVAVSEPKETRYYGPYTDVASMTPEAYCESMAHKPGARYRCDATPAYLSDSGTVARIAAENPDARYIVMVRDQADLAFSLHQEFRLSGSETIADFEEAWRACDARRAGKRVPVTCGDARRLLYDHRASVGKQLAEVLQIIPRERIMIIEMNALRADIAAVWEALCGFLEIEHCTDVDFTAQNLRKTIRFPILLQASAMAFRLKRRLGIRGGMGVGRALKSAAAPVASERESLSPELRAELQTFFAEDSRLLEQAMLSGPHLRVVDGKVAGQDIDHG
ncbi:sulfotransferase family protein [Salipiger thiooxidans]|uniref:sulfotransferase family protein n=1 Tax=Salipiger thiooxidans TaxID=282683 RepID=UPI001CD2237C|nr:sulfotransferase [Salipiger thiooxidans]MCA0849965.1 sulfotransferase [Salipiger thiooxidans]